MRSRSKLLALLALAASATALGVLAASGLGGQASGAAVKLDPDRTEIDRVATERVPLGSGLAVAAKKKKSSKKVKFQQRVGLEARTVEPGGEDVVALQCPKKTAVVTGGTLTQGPGLVTSNQSRANPTGGQSAPRTYYVGVVNLTEALGGAQALDWLPGVVCAKNAKGD